MSKGFLLKGRIAQPPPRRIICIFPCCTLSFSLSLLRCINATDHSLSFVVREWKTETKFKHSTCTRPSVRSLFFLCALHAPYNDARCSTLRGENSLPPFQSQTSYGIMEYSAGPNGPSAFSALVCNQPWPQVAAERECVFYVWSTDAWILRVLIVE